MPCNRGWISLASALALGLAATAARADKPAGPAAADEFFEKEVRPVLVERCQKCHGTEKPKAGLRLLSRASVLEGGDSGPAAVAGNPEDSLLVQAIQYDGEPKMPPKEKLSNREIEILTRWVALGLPWPEHKVEAKSPESAAPAQMAFTDEQRRFWSFQPVKQVAPAPVGNASWVRTQIDRFILGALEKKGLEPALPADKRTLIRRARFDLIGLPPTPEEIHAFLADDSPEAFARVVERLLASPRYGERWGRHWLDVVRYADSRDSRGLGGDSDITEAYRYRDWVVSAFNRDLPYDQFIIQQLAGDLVPGRGPGGFNPAGLVATGLLTIGEWGTGDADKEKMVTDIVDDQIDVVGRAFLGLTIACARCHDHKFDPIPTEDYYGLAGIFFSTHILPDPGAKTAGSPLLRTPLVPPEVVEAARKHKARVAELEAQVKERTEHALALYARGLLSETSRYLAGAWDFSHAGPEEPRCTLAECAALRHLNPVVLGQWVDYLGLGTGRHLNQQVPDLLGKPGVFAWKGPPSCPSLTVNTRADEVALLTFKLAPHSVSVHPGPQSPVAVAWQSPVSGRVQITGRLADEDPVDGDGVAWTLSLRSRATRLLASGALANGASQRFDEGQYAAPLDALSVEAGDWIVLAVLPRNNYTCDTTRIEISIALADGFQTWDLARDLVNDPLAGSAGNPHPDRFGHSAVWHFLDLDTHAPVESQPLFARWREITAAVDAGAEPREAIDAATRAIQEHINQEPSQAPAGTWRAALLAKDGPLSVAARDLPPEARQEFASIEAELTELRQNPPPAFPLALAAQEGGVPRTGYEGFGDARVHIRGNYQRLGRKVPRHFPRIIAGDEQPPITQGSGRLDLARWIARAEHPLTARVMVNRIWQHHFGAGLVRTPSNFGKLGERPTHPELLDYLAARFVAEGWSVKAMHRAIMLSAVYQQSSRPAGDSLRLDPDNRLLGRMNRRRLEAEALRDSLLAASGQLDQSMGGTAFRALADPKRTVYLMTIRSDRSSYGPLFDAADPAAVVDQRTQSTVAPQALFLLNNPMALDQARALARRIQEFPAAGTIARIERLYECLFARLPSDQEISLGLEALAPSGHENALDDWAAYCQVLLCMNEFIYID